MGQCIRKKIAAFPILQITLLGSPLISTYLQLFLEENKYQEIIICHAHQRRPMYINLVSALYLECL